MARTASEWVSVRGSPARLANSLHAVWDALALLRGARGQREQHQSYCCECARHGSRSPASQAASASLRGMPRASPVASFSDWMVPVVSTWPYVLHNESTHQ